MLAQLRRYARNASIAIVLEGESGTGKTSLARAIHEWSPRAAGPYHAVALSSIDDGLVASALFGHIQGAYTDARSARAGAFASASGGTLFLDEIGKASFKVQHALLDAIESHVIRPAGSDRDVRLNIRIVAATSVPLRTLVDKGQFLDDLCARLDGFRVYVPALRERRADIPGFVHAIIARHAPACGYAQAPAIDDALMSVLQRAPWRYNLRELDATLHRMLIDAEGAGRLTLDLCVGELAHCRPKLRRTTLLAAQEVEDVMKRAAGNKSAAARMLHVDRTTLYRTLERAKRQRATGT